MTNIVVSPKFNNDEFIKEKGVVIDEIKQQNDQPEEKLFNYFLNRVWINFSYGNSILGTEQSIKKLEIDDLRNFIQNITPMKKFVSRLLVISQRIFIKVLKKVNYLE